MSNWNPARAASDSQNIQADIDPYQPPLAVRQELSKEPRPTRVATQYSVFRLALSRVHLGVWSPHLLVAGIHFAFAIATVPLWLFVDGMIAPDDLLEAGELRAQCFLVISACSLFVSLLTMSVQTGLAMPLRSLVVEGAEAEMSPQQNFGVAVRCVGRVMATFLLIMFLTVSLGPILILPGLFVLFFFQMAPYLAAQGSRATIALSTSAKWAWRHKSAVGFATGVAIIFLVFVVLEVIFVETALLRLSLSSWANLAVRLVNGIALEAAGVFLYLFWASTAILVETTEHGVELNWDGQDVWPAEFDSPSWGDLRP